MRPLSDAEALRLWETGIARHSLDRGLLALASAFPEVSPDTLADWPLGRRNRLLAQTQCHWFGPRLRASVACVRCAEKLEFELDGRAFSDGKEAAEERAAEPIRLGEEAFRLPSSRDIARVACYTDLSEAARALAASCRLTAGQSLAAEWSAEELEQIGAKMAAADPLAETRLALRCPECGHAWEANLDLAEFLWTEIEARARRLLSEVHQLALAYGWSEREILSFSPHRRAVYLELIHR